VKFSTQFNQCGYFGVFMSSTNINGSSKRVVFKSTQCKTHVHSNHKQNKTITVCGLWKGNMVWNIHWYKSNNKKDIFCYDKKKRYGMEHSLILITNLVIDYFTYRDDYLPIY